MKVQNKAVSEREAQALTAEIDQATDAAVVAEQQHEVPGVSGEGAGAWEGGEQPEAADLLEGQRAEQLERARGRGERVLDQAAWNNEVNTGELNSGELARDEAELERDEAELNEPEEFVGAESGRQAKERLEADWDDWLTERRKGSPRDFRLMTASTERLTSEAVVAVDHLIKEEVTHPASLEKLKHRMTVTLLKGAYNRVFGDRN